MHEGTVNGQVQCGLQSLPHIDVNYLENGQHFEEIQIDIIQLFAENPRLETLQEMSTHPGSKNITRAIGNTWLRKVISRNRFAKLTHVRTYNYLQPVMFKKSHSQTISFHGETEEVWKA